MITISYTPTLLHYRKNLHYFTISNSQKKAERAGQLIILVKHEQSRRPMASLHGIHDEARRVAGRHKPAVHPRIRMPIDSCRATSFVSVQKKKLQIVERCRFTEEKCVLSAEPTLVRSNVEVISLTDVFLQEWQLCLQLLHPEHEPVPPRRRGHHLVIEPVEDLCSKSAHRQ